MTKKNKLAEMQRRKAALEAKIKAVKESQSKFNTGVAFLIESELEKAEIVLAAKGIIEKLGKMAEDLAKVNGDDIMPMMDSLKAAFGPQMAETFQSVAAEKLTAAVTSLTQIKDALSSEVSKLEGVVNGETSNDMANFDDAGAADPLADPAADLGADPLADPAAELGADPLAGADAGLEGDLDADAGLEADVDAEIDDLFADDDAAGAAGRAKKESVESKGAKALRESNDPDALIFNSFRKALREGASPAKAARAVAKVFGVDFADVVEIVRESRQGK
jgi:hypothetical protein